MKWFLAFAFITKLFAQSPADPLPFSPGITLIPTLTVTKSGTKALHAMGFPAPDSDSLFVFVQFKDPSAQSYLITVRYSWQGTVHSLIKLVQVTGTPDQSSQAYAQFDIPDMGVTVLGVAVEIVEPETPIPTQAVTPNQQFPTGLRGVHARP